MSRLAHFLRYARQSNRLIQSVALAFVLSLGVAIASPTVQAHNQTPDQQIICLGNGGMQVVTFATDGTVSNIQNTHGLDCPLCTALQAPPPATRVQHGLQAIATAKPIWLGLPQSGLFENHAPAARAPPLTS